MSVVALLRRPAVAWRRLRANRLAVFGFGLLALVAAIALAAPLLPLPDPYVTDLSQRLLPAGSPGHPLGTDQLGRDLLARLVWGTRSSIAVGLFAVLIAAFLGTLVGLAAGYFRGWVETLLMRGIDVLLAFPYLLLALAIVAALGPGLRNAMIAIAVVNIPFFARTLRGAVVGLVEREFVAAARLCGAGHARILMVELFPNVLPVVVTLIATNLGWMILETAGLSFLGLGAQPPSADLGSMLGSGREFLATVPRVAILPGVVILMLVVGINLVGDAVRDLLDPRLRGEATTRPAPPASAPTGGRSHADAAVLMRADGLSVQFHQGGTVYRALDGLSFELRPGERLAIVGESGSGKTVTALSLLGLLPHPGRIVGGSVRFQGEDLLGLPESRRRRLRGRRIAFVPQDPMAALNPVLSVGAQLAETLRAHRDMDRGAAREGAVELLARVRIPRPRDRVRAYPHELSGGMRQRVLIAMALAHDPALIIADEPTTALDTTVQAEILALLETLCDERGTALLFISHDLALVRRLCRRVLVLYAGKVVEEGPLDAVLSGPLHPYARALLDCAPELGRPDKLLQPIAGQPPRLDELPSGCHFAPRCRYAQPRCGVGEIGLRPFASGHRVRCIRVEEIQG
jgi:peptide/nickel transport system permease protein